MLVFAMQHSERFYTVFLKSLTDPSYYRISLSHKTFWYSLKYLSFLTFLIAVVFSISATILLIGLSTKMPQVVGELRSGLTQFYPEQLRLTMQSGSLITNVNEPYVIDLPTEWNDWYRKNMSDAAQRFPHMVVIDTSASVSSYPEQKSLLLLTKNNFVTLPRRGNSGSKSFSDGAYQVYPYDKTLSGVLDRHAYDLMLDKSSPYIDMLPNIVRIVAVLCVVVLPFIITLFMVIGYLLYLLFATLIVWIIALIWGKSLKYSELYRFAMHAMTLPVLFSLLQAFVNLPIPFVFTALLVIWMTFILREFPSKQPA